MSKARRLTEGMVTSLRVSAALFLDHNLRITGSVDLSSSTSTRRSENALMNALGEIFLHKGNVVNLLKHEEASTTPVRDTALQAWAAGRAGSLPSMHKILSDIPRIDTKAFGAQVHA
jgi:hypothetical protein